MKLTREITSIPYTRLDVDPDSPSTSTKVSWKLFIPVTLSFIFFIFYMDFLSIDSITEPFINLRNQGYFGSIFERYDIILRKRPEVEHIDCGRIINGDKEYMKEIGYNRPYLVNTTLDMDCDSIKSRILPARNSNTSFPILYARIVYTDYEFLEDELVQDYAEENTYCYAIDKDADEEFKINIHQLSECLPNVIVPKIEEEMDGYGHNQNRAHLECMELGRERQWNYIFLLQNHDVLIKTHEEITEILTIYGGANDVEITPCNNGRCIDSLERNLGELGLCPMYLNDTELETCQNSTIEWGKGAMQTILSREAIDFIFTQIDIKPLMRQLNDMGAFVDEVLYQSLQITEEIRLPGGFIHKCREDEKQFVSRKSIWSGNEKECASGYLRHYICIYGIEDLSFLAQSKFIMANKIMPDFDIGIASCLSELLWNRTRGIIDHPIDKEYYANINTVRYHHQRNLPNFNVDSFECVHNITK